MMIMITTLFWDLAPESKQLKTETIFLRKETTFTGEVITLSGAPESIELVQQLVID